MPISVIPSLRHPIPNPSLYHSRQTKPIIRTQRRTGIRCSRSGTNDAKEGSEKRSYYELLGVSSDSNVQEIKEAYRKLQKKHHPDIAGHEGHERALRLNEAYKVLMREDRRKEYDSAGAGLGYSSWKGPLRAQALFVDENACVGCRECVHHARNTFTMDESLGTARVKVQYGDSDHNIQVSVESCPVNCIHWVEREELAVLEHLMQPQPKEGYGVFGGGWEIPPNVFVAAKAFTKHLKHTKKYEGVTAEETPAQAEARAKASMKMEREKFNGIWKWLKEVTATLR